MPRNVSLSDSKCWNGGQKWVNIMMIAPNSVKGSMEEFPGEEKGIADKGEFM